METKSGSKTSSGSKTNLNESSVPLLEEQEGKGDVPEKIEMETKNENNEEKKDQNETKDKKEKKKKEKKEKVKKDKDQTKRSLDPTLCAQNFTIGLNVLDRDEKRVNEHINILFEDLIGEPDPTHGIEFIWRLTYLLFNATRFWLYRIIAAIIAIPLALLWAVIFALINLTTIWVITPSLRVFDILLHYTHRVWSGIIRTVLDPFFASGALLFNNIRSRRENLTLDSTPA